jgi:cardiolipin synthase A/B
VTTTSDKTAHALAQSVRQLINAGAFAEVIHAVESNTLTAQSGSASIAKLAAGRSAVQGALTSLIATWSVEFSTLSNNTFTRYLEAMYDAVLLTEAEAIRTEVVWTGPKTAGSYLRTTRQVVQDIIARSQSDLLVVGYWLAGKEDYEGIISNVIGHIAEAVNRGVKVTLVLDAGEKSYGKNNLDTLTSLWPLGISMPKILTWKIADDKKYLKLHAKVLVGDNIDSLITSANLTMQAFEKNIEMGIRTYGRVSEQVSKQFLLLEQSGILVPYE